MWDSRRPARLFWSQDQASCRAQRRPEPLSPLGTSYAPRPIPRTSLFRVTELRNRRRWRSPLLGQLPRKLFRSTVLTLCLRTLRSKNAVSATLGRDWVACVSGRKQTHLALLLAAGLACRTCCEPLRAHLLRWMLAITIALQCGKAPCPSQSFALADRRCLGRGFSPKMPRFH